MHIVSTTNKLIKFVPRIVETGSLSLNITDESTNTSATSTVTATNSGNFVSITPTYTFKEGRFYYIVVSGTAELYRGKVFCTDQTDFDKYTTNQNVYTEHDKANANEYIVI
jgi:hypothetical protein